MNDIPHPPPDRIYAIIGEPLRPYTPPAYATDPRSYGLDLFKTPVSDAEFESRYKHRMRAFVFSGGRDYIRLPLQLVGVLCPVYDRSETGWVYNSPNWSLAEDIN